MKGFTRLLELLEDWNALFKRDGWQKTLPTVMKEIAHLPYLHLRFAVLARSLLEPLPDLPAKIPIEIREFQLSDAPLISQIDRPSQAKLCIQRFQRGHYGFVAFHNGQLVSYGWGCPEFAPDLERVQFEMARGDILCVDVYTAPQFRNLGLQTAMTLDRFRVFRDLGYQRAIAYIEVHNLPSLAVWRKVNSQVIGYFDYLRIGPWRWSRFESV